MVSFGGVLCITYYLHEILFSMSSTMHSHDLQARVLQDVALSPSKVPSTVGPYNRGQGAGIMVVMRKGMVAFGGSRQVPHQELHCCGCCTLVKH